jgi:hypothetical protein
MLAIEGHHDEHEPEDAHDIVEEMPEGAMGPTRDSLAPHGAA